MSILVTGAAGQLGAELCRQLAGEATGVDVDTLDLTDRAAVLGSFAAIGSPGRDSLRGLHPGRSGRERRGSLPGRECDRGRVAGRGLPRTRCPLVQVSTDYLFAGSPGIGRPWREDDPPAPAGVYAITKFEGEQAAAAGRNILS